MVSSAVQFYEGKRKALESKHIICHYYNYSSAVHGYAFYMLGKIHIIVNKNKSYEDIKETELQLIDAIKNNENHKFVLIHGKGRTVKGVPFEDTPMSMNLFQFKELIETLNERGVQNG